MFLYNSMNLFIKIISQEQMLTFSSKFKFIYSEIQYCLHKIHLSDRCNTYFGNGETLCVQNTMHHREPKLSIPTNSAVKIRRTCQTIGHFLCMSNKKSWRTKCPAENIKISIWRMKRSETHKGQQLGFMSSCCFVGTHSTLNFRWSTFFL